MSKRVTIKNEPIVHLINDEIHNVVIKNAPVVHLVEDLIATEMPQLIPHNSVTFKKPMPKKKVATGIATTKNSIQKSPSKKKEVVMTSQKAKAITEGSDGKQGKCPGCKKVFLFKNCMWKNRGRSFCSGFCVIEYRQEERKRNKER